MLLFRSEEHVTRWTEQTGQDRGELVGLQTLADLGRRWYGDRLDRDWRRASTEERQSMLDRVGLTGGFWQLA